MSEKAQKPKVKDLDPKDAAQNVKGGCLCCLDAERFTRRGLENGKEQTPKVLLPR